MKNKIEKYIPQAIEAVKKELLIASKSENQNDKNGKKTKVIKSEYNSYISSLASGLVQSGLLPTLAFYTNLNSKSIEPRRLLLQAIYKTLHQEKLEDKLTGDELLKEAISKNEKPLESFQLKEDIKNAAVAIKLAIRTFPLEKRTEN